MTTIPANVKSVADAAKLSLLEITPQSEGCYLAEYDICDLARMATWVTYRERLAKAGGMMTRIGVNLEDSVIEICFQVVS